jgi:hypothetical protein
MAWNADREMPLFERSEPGEVAAETFDDFYAREFSAVVGLAYALSGSRTGAEDLAKEAFLAAHRGWDRVAAFDDTGAWVGASWRISRSRRSDAGCPRQRRSHPSRSALSRSTALTDRTAGAVCLTGSRNSVRPCMINLMRVSVSMESDIAGAAVRVHRHRVVRTSRRAAANASGSPV